MTFPTISWDARYHPVIWLNRGVARRTGTTAKPKRTPLLAMVLSFLVCGVMVLQCGVAVAASSGGRATSGGRQGTAHGTTATQGYLGIDVRDVSADRVGILKLKAATGAEIIHVDHDGPAGKAGLRVSDVVLSMNGQTITSEAQLRRMLRETPPGGSVTLILSRSGEQQTVHTQLADRAAVERQAWLAHMTVPALQGSAGAAAEPNRAPAASRAVHGNGFLSSGTATSTPLAAAPTAPSHSLIDSLMLGSSYSGAVLEVIGPQLAQFFGSPSPSGLLVRSVDANSPAAVAGLRAGDVVLRADSVAISSTGAWARLIRENRGRELAVVILRDHQEKTLRLIPDGKRRSSLEHSFERLFGEHTYNSPTQVGAKLAALCLSTESRVDCTVDRADFA